MEYTIALWIKSIAYLTFAFFLPVGGVYMRKKGIWKNCEYIIVILVSLFILFFGIKNFVYAVNPKIEHTYLKYQYSTNSGEIFGHNYYFVDNQGNDYDLTMDPISERKIVADKELNKESYYYIGYEKRSNVITSIR